MVHGELLTVAGLPFCAQAESDFAGVGDQHVAISLPCFPLRTAVAASSSYLVGSMLIGVKTTSNMGFVKQTSNYGAPAAHRYQIKIKTIS